MQQKIQIFAIFFFLFTISATAQIIDSLYCPNVCPDTYCVDGTEGAIPDYPSVDTIWYNPYDSAICNMDEMLIDGFIEPNDDFPNYAYVVTGPMDPENDNKRPVVGVTEDGTWNFGLDNTERRPYGNYCFTGFGYYQEDMDFLTNNEIVVSVLCQCFPDEDKPCLKGGESLEEIMDVIVNNEKSVCEDSGAFYDLDTILCILRETLGIYKICAKNSCTSYCVEYAEGSNETLGPLGCYTAISEFDLLGFEGIYPNPVINEATVVFNAGEHDFVNVEIYNLTGQRIYSDGYLAEPGKNEYRIDVGSWNQGYYFIKLDDGKEVITKRMIVNP